MARKFWVCSKCRYRNERIKRVCVDCGEGRRPKPRVTRHAQTLRDDPYETYNQLNALIHGVKDESCGACGKPRSQDRRHDRDHDHLTGNPRGLLCGGNRGCNVLLVPWVTAATARGIAQAKEVAAEKDAERWWQLAGYLERVEDHYDREAA